MPTAPPTDHVVAALDELDDGAMREIEAGGAKLLLVRRGDELFATGATCPHYGASLAKGIVCGRRVVCPWHKSVFSLESGAVLEPPSPDGVPTYAVRVEGGDVVVTVPADPADHAPPPPMPAGTDARTFVVLGGGAAGHAAVETLRGEAKFAGRLVLVDREGRLPYDRTQLSKGFLTGKKQADDLPIRPDSYYAERRVERVAAEAVSVDTAARRIDFVGHPSIEYDAVLIAPGGTPRTLGVPGEGSANVFTLRSLADAKTIVDAAESSDGWVASGRAVVVGNGFIGMETAASLTQRGLKVTVVSPDAIPFEKLLGERVGRRLKSLHESKGVEFVVGKVASFATDDEAGRATAATLEDGASVEGDLFVVGLGVTPATSMVRGVSFRQDGGIKVDARLRAADGAWAAGDVAGFPDRQTGEPVRIEHWRLAEQHGRAAALDMAGGGEAFDGVPFFWSNQYDLRLDYVGHAEGFDEVIYDGDVESGPFIAFYVKAGRVLAASAVKRDDQDAALMERMRLGTVPTPDALRGGGVDLLAGLP